MPAKRPSRSETPPRPARPSGDSRRLEDRFRHLVAASARIFSQHTLPAVLQEVVDAARGIVGARYAALALLAPDGSSFESFVTSGIDLATRERIGALPSGRGLLGLVIRERRVIRTADINYHPERYGFPPNHPAMHSFLGVPVTTGEKVLGNLYLTEKLDAVEFDEKDEDIAVMLAAQAAVAVENARLSEGSAQLLGQIQAMQRQRDLFFAMMNHELRNALTGVYGWAERLVRRKTPESADHAAQEVYEGTERTITLLNNFLDLTRLDAGRMQPVRREVDPATVVRRVLTGFEPAAEAKALTLSANLPGQLPAIETDPVRLQQILVNLVSNAVRHSPTGGRIEVAVHANGDAIEFAVCDDGPGIPAEVRERIFEPFERFDPGSGVGTGLGLPVSRRLAEVLGGKLSLTSAPGEGAVFTVSLPLARPD
ncbi:MAG TPA: GAF domain-containing sensor histidine kinase [Gemmatimonadales bacterium]|nr:GAF domain-containing sensor histidine kinase [Gemmatimonadales bacterium]